MARWLRFNAVGAIGMLVQLGVLAVLVKLGVHYLAATALAVEAAVLHNYAWHIRWTWKERRGRLWRFHLANGLVSMTANLAWMRLFAGWLGIPPLAANLMAIALTSAVNFLVGDRWVFSARVARTQITRAQITRAQINVAPESWLPWSPGATRAEVRLQTVSPPAPIRRERRGRGRSTGIPGTRLRAEAR